MDTPTEPVSIAELPALLKRAGGQPIVLSDGNGAKGYLVPAEYFERLMARLEDLEDVVLVKERLAGPFVEVSLDEL